eukprot:g3715.t1
MSAVVPAVARPPPPSDRSQGRSHTPRAIGAPPCPSLSESPRLLFAFCFWCAVCGGSIYAFGSFAEELKTRCVNWGSPETNLIYSLGQLGNSGLGLLVALLYRARNCMLYATANIVIGTGLFLAGIRCLRPASEDLMAAGDLELDEFNRYFSGTCRCSSTAWLAGVGYFLIQQGGCAIYQCGLFYQLGRANAVKAAMLSGLITSGNGLSAFIWSLYFDLFCAESIAVFFLSTAVLWLLTAWTGIGLVFEAGGSPADASGGSPPAAEDVEDGIMGNNAVRASEERTSSRSRRIGAGVVPGGASSSSSSGASADGSGRLGPAANVRLPSDEEQRAIRGSGGGSGAVLREEYGVEYVGGVNTYVGYNQTADSGYFNLPPGDHAADAVVPRMLSHTDTGRTETTSGRVTSDEYAYGKIPNGANPNPNAIPNGDGSNWAHTDDKGGPARLQFWAQENGPPQSNGGAFARSGDYSLAPDASSQPTGAKAGLTQNPNPNPFRSGMNVPLLRAVTPPRFISENVNALGGAANSLRTKPHNYSQQHLLPPVPEDIGGRAQSDPLRYGIDPGRAVRRRAQSLELPRPALRPTFRMMARVSLARLVEVNPLESSIIVPQGAAVPTLDVTPPTNPRQVGTRDMLASVCFWFVAAQFALLQGVASGFFLANGDRLGEVYEWREDIGHLLQAQSLVNSAARIFFGFAMDLGMRSSYHIEFARHLLLTMGACFLSLQCCEGHPLLAFALLGIGFGGNWAILPAVITSWYGRANVAVGFNVACLFFVLGSNLFAAGFVKLDTGAAGVEWMRQLSVFLVAVSGLLGVVLTRLKPCRAEEMAGSGG